MSNSNLDTNPTETQEWRDSFLSLLALEGGERAKFILDDLVHLANTQQISWVPELVTPYVNSIPVDQQPPFPGDLAIEEKLASLMRWNALAMVAKANGAYPHDPRHFERILLERRKPSANFS